MRRAWMVPLLALLVVGCSSSSSRTTVACVSQFWNGTFGTCLPAGWKVLSRETLRTLGVPEETVAAFQVENARSGQFDTVTVTREPLPQDTASSAYSDANVAAVSALPDYKLIDKSSLFIDGNETALHVFSARPIADTPIRRYYQVSAVSSKTGYTFTGSFPLGIETTEATEVEFILKNVTFTNPQAASSSAASSS